MKTTFHPAPESDSESTDPRTLVTAWAFDELSPDERAAFERVQAEDPDMSRKAAETKEFCDLMRTALRQPTPELQHAARARLLFEAGRPKRDANVIRRRWLRRITAVAACMAAGSFLFWHWYPNKDSGNLTVEADPGAHDSPPGQTSPPETMVSIKPAMPKPLFAGTPLPQNDPPPNLDRSGKPVLEMKVPAGVTLISKGKPVTSSDPAPLPDASALQFITDGDKQGDDGYFADLQPGKQWIEIDLGETMEVWLIWMWHFHKQAVLYRDVVVQVSDDGDFKTATVVFNNDYDNSSGFGTGKDMSYIETNNGRPMPVAGTRGRYVRCWSNGRDIDDTNQYIEVEVYGRKPAAIEETLLAGSDEMQRLFKLGTGHLDLGQYREAEEQFNKLLALDPANTAARRMMERAERELGNSLMSARDHTRQKMLYDVDNLWVSPVPGNVEFTVRPEMPKPLFAGTPLPYSLAANPPEMTGVPGSGGGGGRGTGRGGGVGAGMGFGSSSGGTERYRYYEQGRPARTDVTAPVADLTSGTESYQATGENPFHDAQREPLSTFSVDVDTASYSNVRRFLNMGHAPPVEAVRLEELVNYFPYDYAPPKDGKPFAVHVEMTATPWHPHHRLARIALKGREIPQNERPAANLVFLVDVSGSMQPDNKLPLVKQSLRFVVERLTDKDTVSLVTYAGETGAVLPATNGADKARIMAAIECLGAGGSTNGAGGIQAAYAQAQQHFIKGGINRVVLATDGDFNVGITSHEELLKLITDKAKTGVFLSVLGYGMGNVKDDTLELLADKGNGNYAYIDSLSEARKSLAEQFNGTLVTIAKDVKIQIEFNPAVVRNYRLLGYENRMLAKEDFNNDKKDAGEIGAGHTVTALYELVPVNAPADPVTTVEKLKYQKQPDVIPVVAEESGEKTYLKAHLLLLEAEKADEAGFYEIAAGGYRQTLALLQLIKKTWPEWNPEIVEYRLKDTTARIGRVDRKEPTTKPAPASTEGTVPKPVPAEQDSETMTVKLRWKAPDAEVSEPMEVPVKDSGAALAQASAETRWAVAVAGFAALLRDSVHAGLTWEDVRTLAKAAKGPDPHGYRGEFLLLLDKAESLKR